jgi:hypothetical protein
MTLLDASALAGKMPLERRSASKDKRASDSGAGMECTVDDVASDDMAEVADRALRLRTAGEWDEIEAGQLNNSVETSFVNDASTS